MKLDTQRQKEMLVEILTDPRLPYPGSLVEECAALIQAVRAADVAEPKGDAAA